MGFLTIVNNDGSAALLFKGFSVTIGLRLDILLESCLFDGIDVRGRIRPLLWPRLLRLVYRGGSHGVVRVAKLR